MLRKRYATVVLAILCAVSACGSSDASGDRLTVESRREASNPPPLSKEVGSLDFPFDKYVLSTKEQFDIYAAEDILMHDCLMSYDVKWPLIGQLRGEEQLNRRRYGAMEMHVARVYGYHDLPDLPEARARDRRENELNPRERAAAYGKSGTAGCWETARREFMKGTPSVDYSTFNHLASKAFEDSQKTSEVEQAIAAWSRCMHASGFKYAHPFAATDDSDWKMSKKPSTREIATAVSDVSCKKQVKLIEIWAKVERGIQDKVIAANLDYFKRLGVSESENLRLAREIIDASSTKDAEAQLDQHGIGPKVK